MGILLLIGSRVFLFDLNGVLVRSLLAVLGGGGLLAAARNLLLLIASHSHGRSRVKSGIERMTKTETSR